MKKSGQTPFVDTHEQRKFKNIDSSHVFAELQCLAAYSPLEKLMSSTYSIHLCFRSQEKRIQRWCLNRNLKG